MACFCILVCAWCVLTELSKNKNYRCIPVTHANTQTLSHTHSHAHTHAICLSLSTHARVYDRCLGGLRLRGKTILETKSRCACHCRDTRQKPRMCRSPGNEGEYQVALRPVYLHLCIYVYACMFVHKCIYRCTQT